MEKEELCLHFYRPENRSSLVFFNLWAQFQEQAFDQIFDLMWFVINDWKQNIYTKIPWKQHDGVLGFKTVIRIIAFRKEKAIFSQNE